MFLTHSIEYILNLRLKVIIFISSQASENISYETVQENKNNFSSSLNMLFQT